MSAAIFHHPAFGKPPVVNTVRVYNDSRKRKVVRLTKARRFALRMRREQREREEEEGSESVHPAADSSSMELLLTRLVVMVNNSIPGAQLTQLESYRLQKAFIDVVGRIVRERGGKPAA